MSEAVLSEPQFMLREAQRIDDELFRRRFSNWRMSVGGLIVIVWSIAAMYRYLEEGATTLRWAAYSTLLLAIVAGLCLAYERVHSMDRHPGAQQEWMFAWTAASAATGAVVGLLPWFLPATRLELQFSAAALVSSLMIVFVVSRARRVLIYATVAAYTLALSLSLAVHAHMPWAVPVCLIFTAMLAGMGMMMNRALRQSIGEQLYAAYLHGELQRSHSRQLRVQEREAAINERQRMMADLHDGFGAQLLTSLRLLESGQVDTAGAAGALRECIDDLRLMVDAHEEAARNVETLLGMLRYRLQARIQAAGIQLHWRIGELPDGATLPATQALDLLRILQQAIANVLQHADAGELAIVVRRAPRTLEISVEDDGKGFDPAALTQHGRGLAGMQRRAARLGGEIAIEPREEGGTAVRLRLRLPLGSGAWRP